MIEADDLLCLIRMQKNCSLPFRASQKKRKIQPLRYSYTEECADMTNKDVVTALTLGFLAFTLSVVPVAKAEAPWKTCEAQGNIWDKKTARCIKPGEQSDKTQDRAPWKTCEMQGNIWDKQTARCIKAQ
jgi:hypothetical protein